MYIKNKIHQHYWIIKILLSEAKLLQFSMFECLWLHFILWWHDAFTVIWIFPWCNILNISESLSMWHQQPAGCLELQTCVVVCAVIFPMGFSSASLAYSWRGTPPPPSSLLSPSSPSSVLLSPACDWSTAAESHSYSWPIMDEMNQNMKKHDGFVCFKAFTVRSSLTQNASCLDC